MEFKLPNLGEGMESGTVVGVLVKPGDVLEADQAVLEIEADKATVELPCPHAGAVTAIHVKEGDQVSTGDPVLTLDADAAAAAAEPKSEAKPSAEPEPKSEATDSPVATQPAPRPEPKPTAVLPRPAVRGHTPAGPAVRRLARLLGVDLSQVNGSGERGRITPDDVHAYLRALGASAAAGGAAPQPLPDFTRWGTIEEKPISGIRRSTAQAMARAWATIPHVTHFDLADVTELEASRKAFRAGNPKGPKVTMTVLVLKALVSALKAYPAFNTSFDEARGVIVHKRYYHLGVAVDTDAGLLVPVVRDADKKSIQELATEITALAERARDRKLSLDDMRGGTFTVSNLGGIGGIGFTPIVNWPQVAILGLSRARQEYRPGADGPEPRLMMPLSLSYDHRVIDGAEAARFARHVAELLSDPGQLLFTV
ncbi:MAG: 2-oxo acid dehydrogenase subunit E2 [Planctomycetes bacterium]|nr:2-oxo acid dehydrogenase subunit E2 [Planctomycetota bacterium]